MALTRPAHNEEHQIDRTLGAYRVGSGVPQTRFLVAADAGTGASADIVRERARRGSGVGLFEYPKLGKGGVIA